MAHFSLYSLRHTGIILSLLLLVNLCLITESRFYKRHRKIKHNDDASNNGDEDEDLQQESHKLTETHDTTRHLMCSFHPTYHQIIRTKASLKNGAHFLTKYTKYDADECQTKCCQHKNCSLIVYKGGEEENSCYLFDCANDRCLFVEHKTYMTVAVHRSYSSPDEEVDDLAAKGKTVEKEKVKETHDYDDYSATESTKQSTKLEKNHGHDSGDLDDEDITDTHTNDEDNHAHSLRQHAKHSRHRVPSSNDDEEEDQTEDTPKSTKHHSVAESEADNSKSSACNKYQVACEKPGKGPKCIAKYDLCNGIKECADGSDEKYCQEAQTSPDGGRSAERHDHHGNDNHRESRLKDVSSHSSDTSQPRDRSWVRQRHPVSTANRQRGSSHPHSENSDFHYHDKGYKGRMRNQNQGHSRRPDVVKNKTPSQSQNHHRENSPNYRQSPYRHQSVDIHVPPKQSSRVRGGTRQQAYHYPDYDVYYDGNSNDYYGGSQRHHSPQQEKSNYGDRYRSMYYDDYFGGNYEKPHVSHNVGKPGYLGHMYDRHGNKVFGPSSSSSKEDTEADETGSEHRTPHSSSSKATATSTSEASSKQSTTTISSTAKSNKKTSSSSNDLAVRNESSGDLIEVNPMEISRQNSKYTGAIVALSLGLVLTFTALIFVGCRLRNIRRRLRKGRTLNASEADYLINGMYL